MGELKSAWEIAQEKARKLGGLSAEERKKQREKECLQIAKALADKYLTHPDARLLTSELTKYDGQEKELITSFLLRQFADTIDIRFSTNTERAVQGILTLNQNNAVAETLNRIKELLQEHQVAEARQKEDIEKAGREILHQMRISGSAISRINPQARDEWQKKLEIVALPFVETLQKLKQKLLE